MIRFAVTLTLALLSADAGACGQQNYTTSAEYISCVSPSYAPAMSAIDSTPSTADAYSRYQWAMRAVLEGEQYQSLFSDAPADVTVAVIDRWPGHANHPDLVNVYLTGINLIEGGTNTSGVWDGEMATSSNLHGQCAASIIAAEHNSFGMAGVFHRARILPIRSSLDTLASAILVAVANGAKVIHIAGYEATSTQFFYLYPENYGATYPAFNTYAVRDYYVALLGGIRTAIEQADEAGVIVTMGIGNRDGKINTYFIGSRPEPIVVGATNIKDEVSPFNSMSYRYDVFAPGGDRRTSSTPVNVGPDAVSAQPLSNADDVMCALGPNKYSFLSGGSAAGPHVAGAAAIFKSYRPAGTVTEFRRILRQSVRPVTPNLNVIQSDAGLLSLKKLRGNL